MHWSLTRINAYFLMSVEEGIADFKAIVLPDDADPSVLTGFADTAVKALYGNGDHRLGILLHVAAGSVLTALFLFQVKLL